MCYASTSNMKSSATSPSLKVGTDDSSNQQANRPPTAKMGNMMDIGARPLYSSEQDVFRETVRKFIQKEIAPHNLK